MNSPNAGGVPLAQISRRGYCTKATQHPTGKQDPSEDSKQNSSPSAVPAGVESVKMERGLLQLVQANQGTPANVDFGSL